MGFFLVWCVFLPGRQSSISTRGATSHQPSPQSSWMLNSLATSFRSACSSPSLMIYRWQIQKENESQNWHIRPHRNASQRSKRWLYLPRYGHPVEHVPQDDAHHHFVSQVEDDAFSIVVLWFLRSGGRRWGRLRASGRLLRLTFWADSSTCKTWNKWENVSDPQSRTSAHH